MAGIVKSPLQTVVVDGIYNDILTGNAKYYYFLGRTTPWTVADGASPGEDGTWTTIGTGTNALRVLGAPQATDTYKYELDTRNNIITYKLIKPSDVAYVIPRNTWTANTVYDMYDDSYSPANVAYSGATSLTNAKYYVLTSLNNVYKCISNNYDAPSTVQPYGTSTDYLYTSDGYVWKFMYNIPVALQNKFYTYDYIPVMTSLRNRFYENGAITSVAVQDVGSGYTTGVTLTVSGDGYLEDNPYAVGQHCVVIRGGAGYKPTQTITGATWAAGIATITCAGHGFVNGDNVIIRGINPIGYNGNFAIYNATVNTFDVTVTNNPGTFLTGGTLNKNILHFSTPLWGVAPSAATGTLTIDSNGVITAINCDEQLDPNGKIVYGYGYDNTGTLTLDTPFVADYEWVPLATYALNNIVHANENYYRVTTAGTVNSTLPVHTTGTISFGTAALQYIGSDAAVQMVLSKTEALMLPILQGGKITGVQVVNGGVGYTYCTIQTQDTPTNDSAILVADIAIGNIDTIQANVELVAAQNVGALSFIKMAQDELTGSYKIGSGYGPNTTVEIVGDGVGASATPIVKNGSVVGIHLVNAGTGYTREATVNIYPPMYDANGNDIGAKARAILSPPGGHGSNAISEFNSNTLLFYSVLADERIHGLANINDYRQFGVIKNPKRFQSTSRLSTTVATPCYLITAAGTINITEFIIDDELFQNATDVYKVIAIKDNKIVIQALTQTIPIVGEFTNRTTARAGKIVTAINITNAQVDKFTGDILFIDNKLPFVVTSDQMITFRTTIGFKK